MFTLILIKKFKFFKKIVREPNLCEQGSRDFSVDFYLWFTFIQSWHILRALVNLGSHITQAPSFLT